MAEISKSVDTFLFKNEIKADLVIEWLIFYEKMGVK